TDAVVFDVIDRAERRGDLHFAGITRAGVNRAELYRTAKHRGARGDTGLRSRRRGLGHATRLTHFAPSPQHASLRSLTHSGDNAELAPIAGTMPGGPMADSIAGVSRL